MDYKTEYYFSEKTTVRKSPIHGEGRFATEKIRKGELIVEAGGSVITWDELKKIDQNRRYSYLPISSTEVLLTYSNEKFNISHLNHSCSPNLTFKLPRWYASRDICRDEEIVTNYHELNYPSKSFHKKIRCNCKSSNCIGELTI